MMLMNTWFIHSFIPYSSQISTSW